MEKIAEGAREKIEEKKMEQKIENKEEKNQKADVVVETVEKKINRITIYVLLIIVLTPLVSSLNYYTVNDVFGNFSNMYNSEGVYNNGSTIIGTINGSIDEVMIFNTALNSSQISAIYNNQSQRFKSQGTQTIKQVNITSGYNQVNLTTSFNAFKNTNISLFLGYYNGTWHTTELQNLTNSNLFNISSSATNLTLNFTFISNNKSFYTPNLITSSDYINLNLINLSSYKTSLNILNTSWQTMKTNLEYLNNTKIWMWADISNCNASDTRILRPKVDIESYCIDCIWG